LADAGHIEPARDLVRSVFPRIADLVLKLPPLKRGEKYRRLLGGFRTLRQIGVANAAEDVKRIRELWQVHYGKKNRHQQDGATAVEIAAARNHVSDEEVELKLKHSKGKFLRAK